MEIDITDLDGKVLLSDDEIIDYIQSNYFPKDVFKAEDLKEWAEQNGYIEEDLEG